MARAIRESTNRLGWAMGGLAALALSACTSVQTDDEYTGARLAKPDVILVSQFAVSPDEVDLDSGILPDIERAAKATPPSDEEREAGQKIAEVLAKKLVAEIQDLGLNAQLADEASGAQPQAVEIRGQFTSIDEGNRTERMIIGLGAGRSDVIVNVQVYDPSAGSTPVETLQVDAKSGLKPGAAETFAVGAAVSGVATAAAVSTGVAVTSEALGENVTADADRAAKGIAKHLAVFFAQQGWIDKS